LVVSYFTDLPSGATIILVMTGLFGVGKLGVWLWSFIEKAN
jgi:hypothetical protein